MAPRGVSPESARMESGVTHAENRTVMASRWTDYRNLVLPPRESPSQSSLWNGFQCGMRLLRGGACSTRGVKKCQKPIARQPSQSSGLRKSLRRTQRHWVAIASSSPVSNLQSIKREHSSA
jgi:hypothetical protein